MKIKLATILLLWPSVAIAACATVPEGCENTVDTPKYEQCVDDYKHDRKLRRQEERERRELEAKQCHESEVYTCKNWGSELTCYCMDRQTVADGLGRIL